jgi:hypothetical protein
MTEQEHLDAMMEMLRLLWPKGYGSFPFKIDEAPSRVFWQSSGEEGEPVVYGIVYKGSVMHWNEGVEEASILPKGKRRLVNGWLIDRLYPSTAYAGDPEPELEWADEEFIRTAPSAAVAFTTMALSDKMYDRLNETGLL